MKIEGACHPVISECPFNIICMRVMKRDIAALLHFSHIICLNWIDCVFPWNQHFNNVHDGLWTDDNLMISHLHKCYHTNLKNINVKDEKYFLVMNVISKCTFGSFLRKKIFCFTNQGKKKRICHVPPWKKKEFVMSHPGKKKKLPWPILEKKRSVIPHPWGRNERQPVKTAHFQALHVFFFNFRQQTNLSFKTTNLSSKGGRSAWLAFSPLYYVTLTPIMLLSTKKLSYQCGKKRKFVSPRWWKEEKNCRRRSDKDFCCREPNSLAPSDIKLCVPYETGDQINWSILSL